MIPYLQPHFSEPEVPAGFFEQLVEAGFSGDIETGAGSRAVFATDNSIYQVEPAGILFPKTVVDIQIVTRIMAQDEFRQLTITARGGGTGTNGQALTRGIVVDCSRHMNKILKIDPVRKVARVEAGVVKDQLNRALKPYGLFFAPELSTSNRATVGGMVSTDACGQGSCLYGKTSNHVLGLRIILADGTEWWSRPLDEAALKTVLKREDRLGNIYRTLTAIIRDKQERIEEVFPRLNRYMTGYDLAHVKRPDGLFDLNSILCGSEGTLAVITEAELNLLPLPKYAALINIRYGDFNAALEHARTLVTFDIASVETVDEKVLGLAKGDIVWPAISQFFPEDGLTASNGINIAEILADDKEELDRKLAEIVEMLGSGQGREHNGYTIAKAAGDIEAIWTMRKRAVGLLGNVDGSVRPVPFVEDTAVPPENLAAYIREFRNLLDRAGLSYGMFGHVDAGVLHVRPALDLARQDHSLLVREITDAVVALTKKYGGVLWGEHGKGVRSEYTPEFFGDLYPCLVDVKRSFDPHNRLNPGKIASVSGGGLLKIDEVPLRGAVDRIIGDGTRAAYDNAAYCNGNGACFDFDESSPMCPSYKATRDRRFSPKGRATLVKEWLRLLADKGIDTRLEASWLNAKSSILSLPARFLSSFHPANRNDFSHEVKNAMDTCLACKACAGQCPVKVNVPAFRAKFLELYHTRYLRPLKDPIVARIETLLPWLSRIRPAYNLFCSSALGKTTMRLFGLTALPTLASRSLRQEAARMGIRTATKPLLENLSAAEKEQAVVFVVDAFTEFFDPEVALAALRLARKMGLSPWLAASMPNGKALHVHGYLKNFQKTADKTARYLQEIATTGVPLVGLDPSMTLTFRSEYQSIAGKPLQAKVLLAQEWLSLHSSQLSGKWADDSEKTYHLMLHCTEKTNAPTAPAEWKAVFNSLGIDLHLLNIGCCGMAGTFGHEARNRKLSEKIYAMNWQDHVKTREDASIMMATGYSCRSQVHTIEAVKLPHPLQVIDALAINRQK
ncbi:D-2-hydroxyglutarate dehydrogenase YdiJ [Oryzifoliimicrobium ureilyticus]|uniref:D-2-hydroxyglutarate dehydrogenase YdiJ n=1 Tax=Oryzifoliimicrobium ureilyticus TaxID=3113724 RepID=UPI0030764506